MQFFLVCVLPHNMELWVCQGRGLLSIPNKEHRAWYMDGATGLGKKTNKLQAARFRDLGIRKVCGIGFLLETVFLLKVSHFKQTRVA